MKTNLTPDKAGQKLMDKINAAYRVGDKMRVKQDDGSIETWTVRHPATYMCGDGVIWCNEHSSAYLAERVVFPSVLYLTLKKEWFDKIYSGEKKEEYREIKPYWIRRLTDDDYPYEERGEKTHIEDMLFDHTNGHSWEDILKSYYRPFKHFDTIRFTNGYSKGAASFEIECLGIRIGKGKTEWGATTIPHPFNTEIQDTFIIQLGKNKQP